MASSAQQASCSPCGLSLPPPRAEHVQNVLSLSLSPSPTCCNRDPLPSCSSPIPDRPFSPLSSFSSALGRRCVEPSPRLWSFCVNIQPVSLSLARFNGSCFSFSPHRPRQAPVRIPATASRTLSPARLSAAHRSPACSLSVTKRAPGFDRYTRRTGSPPSCVLRVRNSWEAFNKLFISQPTITVCLCFHTCHHQKKKKKERNQKFQFQSRDATYPTVGPCGPTGITSLNPGLFSNQRRATTIEIPPSDTITTEIARRSKPSHRPSVHRSSLPTGSFLACPSFNPSVQWTLMSSVQHTLHS
ncbi:hypothetical protein F5148DRAFT_491153 [Russula earlei]|uniref:Uncharacterized protein n=1 Tax=Russula earlei TaxID=71964 RepID=A0ACC0UGW5_9AGAM|nr:hypothetical protein F5148DRAFT_491153 [Russula earlei]